MGASWIGETVLWAGLAAGSFAVAAVVVLAFVRVAERIDGEPRRRVREPPWWPGFERDFAEYVRAGDGRPW